MLECVQLLTVIAKCDEYPSGKILLCKWLIGDFAGRYTGLWGKVCPQVDGNHKEAICRLVKSAATAYPSIKDQDCLQLVAKLKFDVPEENWEYIYLQIVEADAAFEWTFLSGNADFECEWFDQDKIPFERMPADDAVWYPGILQGKKYQGEFRFAGEPKYTIKYQHLQEVEKF